MKKILLIALLVSASMYSQQTIFWRSEASNGNWENGGCGEIGTVNSQWFYDGFGSNTSRNRPDCSNGSTTRHNLFIGNNAYTTMSLNTTFWQIRALTFQNGASSSRILNGSPDDGTRGVSLTSGIYNETFTTHTLNVRIGIDASNIYLKTTNSGAVTNYNREIFINSNTVVFQGAGNTNVSSVLSGLGGKVTKDDSGTVTFSGNNTYSGATTVNGGSLVIQKTGYNATITTSGISVAFSSAPAKGNYAVLPGALSSSSSLSTSGLSAWQTASFNAATGILTVFDTPSVTLASNDVDNTFCTGTNVTFTATTAHVGIGTVAYDFKVNGSSVQNSVNTFSTTTLTNGQAVTVEITVTGGTLLSSTTATSNSISNTVNPIPATPTISAGGPTTFCLGGSVVLTSSAGDSYLWSTGATTQSITVSASGSYNVSVISSSACQSAASVATVVTTTAQPLWYLDADGDGYYVGAAIASCTSPGVGYTTTVLGGNDCNDTPVSGATIYPGAPEVCYNGILENCNGTLSQGCAPVVVNMATSYHLTTLPSLAIAVAAVPYSYAPYTNIKYRFSVTNVTTGVTAPDVIQTSRFVTIPLSIHAYNATYTITASAVINEEILPFVGNTITVFSPTVQLITLSTASCGSTLATLATQISASPGLNATSYTFRIRLNDTNPTPAYAYSQSAGRFISANSFVGFPLQYSSSYKVSVQYTFNDAVTGLPVDSGYGAECTLNTSSIPLRGLASPVCGSQVTSLSAGISSAVAPYATSYRFRIRLASDNGPTPSYYYTTPNASRFSNLAAFQGITYSYNTVYLVAVEYSVLNGMSTVWSGFGAECEITTPFFPVTSLVASQCGQPTATSLTQTLNITPYPGFPMYMVKLEEVQGEDVIDSEEKEISYSYFKLNQFSIAQPGKSYSVSVKIKLNGVYGDYDTACDLFTTGEIPASELQKAIKPEFKATAYPNPFANNFMLDVKTASESVVSVKVYDMVGRLIDQRDVRVLDLETTTIGDGYPSGVYNVVVSQEDSVETLRVVKR